MFELEKALALFLLLNVGAGLARILRGPTAADRMLAAQLFGTTGVAVLLLLARGLANPFFRDIALVFSLLSVLTAAAFVKLFWRPSAGKEEENR
jgi:multicomponent Na+:H+ antiporter subunit F